MDILKCMGKNLIVSSLIRVRGYVSFFLGYKSVLSVLCKVGYWLFRLGWE